MFIYMDNLLSVTKSQPPITLENIAQLEKEGQLLRVMQTDLKQRIHETLVKSPNKTHPFVAVNGDQIYISLAQLQDERQRQHVYELIRRCQLGSDVDLGSLPIALQQLIEPACIQSQSLLRSLLLAVATGVTIGILAMAVSVLVIGAAELILQVSLDKLGEMRITAVSFVIFAVLGWIGAAVYFWRRMQP